MRTQTKGFTLIELMVVVAILGGLSAFAVSQYRTYVARSQVARAMGEVGSLKSTLEDCVQNGRLEFGTLQTQCDPAATGSSILTGAPNVGAVGDGLGAPFVTFEASGSGAATIVGTFGNAASSLIAGRNVTWTRDSAGGWRCTSTVATEFVSQNCPAE